MKIKKQYLIPAVLACAFMLMQNSFSIAGTKSDVDEELSPYKWGHWDRMVPPAAGPVALAPAAVTAALPSPDPIDPPDPPPSRFPSKDIRHPEYGKDQPVKPVEKPQPEVDQPSLAR
ncbi:MAG: hypothetical protein KKA54_07360 [Proteobacteria bacterium]|nr:hypothetical protein [Pseudomonadota bacterium]